MKRSSLAAAWLLPVTPVTQITSKWHIRFGTGLQVISQAISWRITNRQLTVQHILYYILSNSGFVKKTIKYSQSVPGVYQYFGRIFTITCKFLQHPFKLIFKIIRSTFNFDVYLWTATRIRKQWLINQIFIWNIFTCHCANLNKLGKMDNTET